MILCGIFVIPGTVPFRGIEKTFNIQKNLLDTLQAFISTSKIFNEQQEVQNGQSFATLKQNAYAQL